MANNEKVDLYALAEELVAQGLAHKEGESIVITGPDTPKANEARRVRVLESKTEYNRLFAEAKHCDLIKTLKAYNEKGLSTYRVTY